MLPPSSKHSLTTREQPLVAARSRSMHPLERGCSGFLFWASQSLSIGYIGPGSSMGDLVRRGLLIQSARRMTGSSTPVSSLASEPSIAGGACLPTATGKRKRSTCLPTRRQMPRIDRRPRHDRMRCRSRNEIAIDPHAVDVDAARSVFGTLRVLQKQGPAAYRPSRSRLAPTSAPSNKP